METDRNSEERQLLVFGEDEGYAGVGILEEDLQRTDRSCEGEGLSGAAGKGYREESGLGEDDEPDDLISSYGGSAQCGGDRGRDACDYGRPRAVGQQERSGVL